MRQVLFIILGAILSTLFIGTFVAISQFFTIYVPMHMIIVIWNMALIVFFISTALSMFYAIGKFLVGGK